MLVCVGIPTIDGKVCAATIDSLLAEQLRAFKQGDYIFVAWQVGCSLIGHARNKIVKQFLDVKEAECLVFVDADISWNCGDLLKLAHSSKEVIGATYRTKDDTGRFHAWQPHKVGDLYRCAGIPGGFMKVNRRVFDKMPAQPYRDHAGEVWHDWFPTGFKDGVLFGEDYGFCRLWREAGGAVWLDSSIKLKHHGGAQVFAGDPAEWLSAHSV